MAYATHSEAAPARIRDGITDVLARLAGVACIVAMLVSYVFVFDHLMNGADHSVLSFLVLSVAPVALMYLALLRDEPDTFAKIGYFTGMINICVPFGIAVGGVIMGVFLWLLVPAVPFEHTFLYGVVSYLWPSLIGGALGLSFRVL
ncbi:MAG: hypothetical protein DI629_17615 [Mesorhizobium amorphae]|nr:MAG: hypothetical protein DI629_17615 [Mesorhizobium amorphae]